MNYLCSKGLCVMDFKYFHACQKGETSEEVIIYYICMFNKWCVIGFITIISRNTIIIIIVCVAYNIICGRGNGIIG